MWKKDDLSALHEEEKLPNELTEENHLYNITTKQLKDPELSDHRDSQHSSRWKKFIAKRKRKNSPTPPQTCSYLARLSKGEIFD